MSPTQTGAGCLAACAPVHISTTRCPKSPGFTGPSPPAHGRQRPEPAGLMRSAWDPHLVAIERGAALGREEAQISCSTKERRGMSAVEQRPRGPPHFPPPAQPPPPSLGVCKGTGSCLAPLPALLGLVPGNELPILQAETPISPAAPHRLPATAAHGSHGHAGPPSCMRGLCPPVWCRSGSRSRPCCSRSGVKITLPTLRPHRASPSASKGPWEESSSPSEAGKVMGSRQGQLCAVTMGM